VPYISWAGVCFNLGLAGTAGAWFTLVRPVWRQCAGVAGARFTLTALRYRRSIYPPPSLGRLLLLI